MNTSTMVLAALLASAVCWAQNDNRWIKAAGSGYALRPTIIKDEGCAKDYVRAIRSEGIEQRKLLADLIKYQCISKASDPVIYSISIRASMRPGPGILLHRALIIAEMDLTEMASGKTRTPEVLFDEAIVLDSDILWVSHEEMLDRINELLRKRRDSE